MDDLLQALTSGDNVTRRNAEAQFDSALKSQPDTVIVQLAESCANENAHPVVRSLGMVLLRRILYRQSELWTEVLRPETKGQVQRILLMLLSSPALSDRSMRKKLCDSISMVAYMVFDEDEEWPELLQTMFRFVTTPGMSENNKENALSLFTNLAESLKLKYIEQFPTMASILNSLASNAEPSLDVRIGAVRAAWCLVAACNEDAEGEVVSPFKVLVGTTLDVIAAVVVANHPRKSDPIEDLIDLAGSPHVRLFSKKDIERTLHMMFELAAVKTKKDSQGRFAINLRLLAIEFVVTLMETRSAAIRKMKPPQNAALVAIFPILISMMMELPDLQPAELKAWGERYPSNASSASASQHDEDEDDCIGLVDFEVFGAALDYVDRITAAMKAKHVLPILYARVGELLQRKDEDWRFPHTALLILGHIVEFIDNKEPELGQLCTTAASFAIEHPYMRVRHAAFTFIARLSFDCAPDVHRRHSQTLMRAFLAGLADPVPRVQAHSAISLINYCTACQDYEEFEVALKPYLGEVVTRLFTALQTSPLIVQENIISALAGVARTSSTDFLPYYQSLPLLKNALAALTSPHQYALKARIIDCIAVIGSSVGKEVFLEDARWLLHLLESTPLLGDEPDVQHIQAAWMTLGQVLGEDIGPFLAKIVPFTLQMANKPIENDSEDDENGDNDEVDMEAQMEQEKIRTAAVDDRLLALEMLCSFAHHTKKGFLPFLKDTLELFCRDVRIENCGNEDVRGRIAEGFPDLIRCAMSCLEEGVLAPDAFGAVLTETLEVLCVGSNSEDSLDNLKIVTRSLMDVLLMVHPLVVSTGKDACPEYVEPCAAVLIQLMKDSIQRRALEFASLKCDTAEDEIDDEAQEDYEAKVRAEHELQYLITAAIGALIKSNPNTFVSSAFMSPSVGPHVTDMAHPVRLCHDQRNAIFVMDDVIEFCSIQTITPELIKSFSEHLISAAKIEKSTSPTEGSSEVAALVQAAAYGLGILAERFGENWQYAPDAARVLVDIITKAPKDLRSDEDYSTCLDNCASSVMKIAKNCPKQVASRGGLNQDILLEAWLQYFPLTGDMSEAKSNSFQLIQMLEERSAPYLMSAKALPLVVRGFANIIGSEALEDRHVDRALNLLEAIKGQIGPDAFNQAVTTVSPEQLQKLAQRVANHA